MRLMLSVSDWYCRKNLRGKVISESRAISSSRGGERIHLDRWRAHRRHWTPWSQVKDHDNSSGESNTSFTVYPTESAGIEIEDFHVWLVVINTTFTLKYLHFYIVIVIMCHVVSGLAFAASPVSWQLNTGCVDSRTSIWVLVDAAGHSSTEFERGNTVSYEKFGADGR